MAASSEGFLPHPASNVVPGTLKGGTSEISFSPTVTTILYIAPYKNEFAPLIIVVWKVEVV